MVVNPGFSRPTKPLRLPFKGAPPLNNLPTKADTTPSWYRKPQLSIQPSRQLYIALSLRIADEPSLSESTL